MTSHIDPIVATPFDSARGTAMAYVMQIKAGFIFSPQRNVCEIKTISIKDQLWKSAFLPTLAALILR